ncbi:MAG: hypothetical protein KF690_01575 [Bacteroidetes bacterium]|nr:hypothetical protein [Bacteroidota bacterium]
MSSTGPAFSLVFVVSAVKRWRKLVIGATVVTMLGAAVISMVIPEYYRAVCIVFPYSPRTSDPRTLFFEDGVSEIFGSKEDVDRIISIGRSKQMARHMIRIMRLDKHYDIDSTAKAFRTRLEKRWEKNVDIVRNDLGAIEIRVLDTDPNTAAIIANTLAHEIDSQFRDGIDRNNQQQLKVYAQNKTSIERRVGELQELLNTLLRRNPGAVITKDGVQGATQPGDVAYIHSYSIQLSLLSKDLADATRRLEQVQSALKAQNKSIFVVESAEVPEVRHSPVRSLLVLSAGLIAFIILVGVACFVEFYKQSLVQLPKA